MENEKKYALVCWASLDYCFCYHGMFDTLAEAQQEMKRQLSLFPDSDLDSDISKIIDGNGVSASYYDNDDIDMSWRIFDVGEKHDCVYEYAVASYKNVCRRLKYHNNTLEKQLREAKEENRF